MTAQVILLAAKTAAPEKDSWVALAACRTSPLGPDAWFPEGGQTNTPTALAARRTCIRECPVSRECLVKALADNEREGIWGGMTPRQRTLFARRVRARREANRRSAPAPDAA